MPRLPGLRAVALLFAALLAMHELRYLLAGRGPEQALTGPHAYLPLAGAAAALLLLGAAAVLARGLVRARRTGEAHGRPAHFVRAWVLAGVALLVAHFAQELLESALSGHPQAPFAVVADGGLLAVALAAVLGALVALGLRGAERALVRAAQGARSPAARRRAPVLARPRRVSGRPGAAPLALQAAGRAPPACL